MRRTRSNRRPHRLRCRMRGRCRTRDNRRPYGTLRAADNRFETNKIIQWLYSVASWVFRTSANRPFSTACPTQRRRRQTFPFCTIEPNVGVITVPDRRLIRLAEIDNPKRVVPTTIEIVDIAGLVKGASKGEGLGNKFLANIRNTNAIIHVLRCFDNGNITHVDGSIDPVRDKGIIDTELQLKDLETDREPARQDPEAGHRRAATSRPSAAVELLLAVQGGAGTGAFGPHRGTGQGGPQTGRRPQPADRQARVVRLQRRREERRDGQRLHRGRPGGHRRRAGRNARHRRRHGGRHRRTGRATTSGRCSSKTWGWRSRAWRA